MKKLYTAFLCLFGTFCGLQSVSQPPLNEPDHNRPKLFRHLPDTILVDLDRLNELLDRSVGQLIRVELSEQVSFPLQGQVVSVVSKYANTIRSIVIRSTNYIGARLSFYKVTLEDGSISYQGRIMSFEHGDVYELAKKNDRFIFIKREFYDVVNE